MSDPQHKHQSGDKTLDRFNAIVVAIVGAAAIVWVYTFISSL